MNIQRFASGLLIVVLVANLVGCGGGPNFQPGVILKGKLVNKGAALQPEGGPLPPGEESMWLELILVQADEGIELEKVRRYYGSLEEDGMNFTFMGPGEEGVPPGKYVFAVTSPRFAAVSDDPEMSARDILGGKFSPANSQIYITVPESKVGGEHDLGTIDLDNPPKGE